MAKSIDVQEYGCCQATKEHHFADKDPTCRRHLPSHMVTADEHTSLYDISKLMREHHIGDVVVTRSGETTQLPIGVLTDRDIFVHGLACDIALDDVAAGDLSAQDLVTVEPDADVFEIASTMNVYAVRRVVVSSNSSYYGIITFDDILWALSLIVSNLSAVAERKIQHETVAEVETQLLTN